MATINIKGQVSYADLSPAQNVRVKIWELDLLPGGQNDLIFNKVVGADGKFAGESSRWDDREGSSNIFPIGIVDAPDLSPNLSFEVTFEGSRHTGPFIANAHNSAPIILPPNFVKPVQKSERDLVQIVYLVNDDYELPERALYSFIEMGSSGFVDSSLRDDYRAVHHLQGSNATLANLKTKLTQVGARAGTEAIDLIFCTHGHTDKMVFADGTKTTDQVLGVLDDIPQATRNKFRMLFSTACFGNTHSQMWLNAGFACASGSEGVYADSEYSLLPFLESWANRNTFRGAVGFANTGVVGNRGDDIAREYYRNTGKTDRVGEINSHRIVSGNGNLRIYSKPR